jgi:uncharacterized integral membrane protein (TIGR00698 family)
VSVRPQALPGRDRHSPGAVGVPAGDYREAVRGLAAIRVLPGLALAGAAIAVALAVHDARGSIPALPLCVAFGVAVSNTTGVPASFVVGLRLAAGLLLRAGVVLLGFDLVFPDVLHLGAKALAVVVAVVALTYVGTLWLGRLLRVPDELALLVAVGFSICGVSAIAAANGVVEADEDEVTFAVALVTLCGTLAIVALPSLRGPLGLSREAYGAWVGAGVHDVAQVVATSSAAGGLALATAVVVKLTRVMLLAPLVTILAFQRSRRDRGPRRGQILPVFVILFVAAIGLASIHDFSAHTIRRIDDVRTVLLGMALFALGARVEIPRLLRIGPRPLVLGLTSWALIAAVAYAGVRVAWT